MTLKECIDIVDNIRPNQYTIKDKVMWLSFIEEIIINDVLKTHEGYDGRNDMFNGYDENKLSTPLIVPSPYDRLYTEFLKMKIDESNGETARYNNSALLYNTYMSEYRKHYNKTHMPISPTAKRFMHHQKKAVIGLSDAEFENLKKELTFILTEHFSDSVSDDKIYDIVTKFTQNNVELLKGKDGMNGIDGKDGYTPQKNIDYFDGKQGKAFTYADFTSEQLENLKGPKGDKGEKGDVGEKGENFTYDDMTQEQKDELTKQCFKFEEGYEDEIDTYGEAYTQKWYKINPPKDSAIVGAWRNYYLYACGNERGELFQMKILDGNDGIFFRTGIANHNFIEMTNTWSEWRRTLLSDEVDTTPTENSTNLITSGAVYDALQNIPSGGGNSLCIIQVQAWLDTNNVDGNPYSDYVLDESIDTVELYNKLRTAYDNGQCIRFILRVTYPEGHSVHHHMDIKEIDRVNFTFYLECSYYDRGIVMIIDKGGFVEIANMVVALPEENSGKLITSGGVYEAIGNIENSLENIIAKYGLGGEN